MVSREAKSARSRIVAGSIEDGTAQSLETDECAIFNDGAAGSYGAVTTTSSVFIFMIAL